MDNSSDYTDRNITWEYDYPIPLKLCNERQDVWSLGLNTYCPDYSDDDFLFGDYTTEKRSYLVLAIHYCNQQKHDLEGKGVTCKSKEEIDEYMKHTIVGLKFT